MAFFAPGLFETSVDVIAISFFSRLVTSTTTTKWAPLVANTNNKTKESTRHQTMDESTLEALGQSLAGDNEWVSSGILVQAHESIDPGSEAIEVDIASTLGFAQAQNRSSVSNFRIWSSNISFEHVFFNTLFLNFYFLAETLVPSYMQFERLRCEITTSTTFGKVLPRCRLHVGGEFPWQNGIRHPQIGSHFTDVWSWKGG
jgi:hypothetical protein